MLEIEAFIYGDITYEDIVDIIIYLEDEQEEIDYEATNN